MSASIASMESMQLDVKIVIHHVLHNWCPQEDKES